MKVGNGIVKKYSREYNRTLKNGEKKKYTTQQIQITIPKNEDIYENKEEVLIIPNCEIEEFRSREEEIEILKIDNYLHIREVNELEKELENSSTLKYENEINNLKAKIKEQNNILGEIEDKYNSFDSLKQENTEIKEKYSNLIIENENLKSKYSSISEEHFSLKESFNNLSIKYDHLKQENLNTKTGYAEIYEANESLEKDYNSLLSEYNDLVDKFNDLQDELHHFKTIRSHDDYITNRVKEFVLRKG